MEDKPKEIRYELEFNLKKYAIISLCLIGISWKSYSFLPPIFQFNLGGISLDTPREPQGKESAEKESKIKPKLDEMVANPKKVKNKEEIIEEKWKELDQMFGKQSSYSSDYLSRELTYYYKGTYYQFEQKNNAPISLQNWVVADWSSLANAILLTKRDFSIEDLGIGKGIETIFEEQITNTLEKWANYLDELIDSNKIKLYQIWSGGNYSLNLKFDNGNINIDIMTDSTCEDKSKSRLNLSQVAKITITQKGIDVPIIKSNKSDKFINSAFVGVIEKIRDLYLKNKAEAFLNSDNR